MELIVVVALVSVNISFPSHESSSKAWSFVTHHPVLLLHVVFGTIVIGEAIAFLIRASLDRRRRWIILGTVGLAFVLIAWVSGENYVATQHNSSLNNMSLAWFGSIVTYAIGWYWGHKKDKISLATQSGASSPTKVTSGLS
jgi:CDP-diglyceride synthetase